MDAEEDFVREVLEVVRTDAEMTQAVPHVCEVLLEDGTKVCPAG
jgi:hypothetical protein